MQSILELIDDFTEEEIDSMMYARFIEEKDQLKSESFHIIHNMDKVVAHLRGQSKLFKIMHKSED